MKHGSTSSHAKRFLFDCRANSASEYALMASLLATMVVASLGSLSSSTSGTLAKVAAEMGDVGEPPTASSEAK